VEHDACGLSKWTVALVGRTGSMHRLDQIHDERGDRIAVAQAVADVVS
jgi:hypothetical protein